MADEPSSSALFFKKRLVRVSFVILAASGIVFAFFTPTTAYANIPTTLGYQGRLSDTNGVAESGTFSFTFRLYSALSGGSALWTETQPAVSVSNGAFAVQLGSVTAFPASLDFNQALYLTTEVESDGEMSPRIPMNAVPYAYTAAGINALSSAPASATGGRMFYNMANGTLNYYDAYSGGWTSLTSATATQALYAQAGLTVLGNVSNILSANSTFTTVATSTVGSGPTSVFTAGKYAYITLGGANQLAIVDITDANNGGALDVVGTVSVGSNPKDVFVAGGHAFVANHDDDTVKILDVTRPAGPTVVGSVDVGSQPNHIFVAGGHAYVSNHGASSVSIIDIDDPTSPFVATTTKVGLNPSSLYAFGKYVYVTNEGDNSLSIINVADPEHPTTITTSMGNTPKDIWVEGRYALMVNGGNDTLSVVDVADQDSPSVVVSVGVGSSPTRVTMAGRYAYVSNSGDNTVTILDTSGLPTAPTVIGTIAVGSSPAGLAMNGRDLFVTNSGTSTMTVVDVKGIETNGLIAHSAALGNLQVQGNALIDNNLNVGGGLTVQGLGIWTPGEIVANELDVNEKFKIESDGSFITFTQDNAPVIPSATDQIKFFSIAENGVPFLQYEDSSGMVQRVNRDTFFLARNVTGSPIPKGSAVYITGSSANNATIAPAKADSPSTVPAMGITAEAITNGSFGRVIQFGLVENVNTSAYTVGNTLWVSTSTAGGLTNVEPAAPFINQPLATVLRSDSVSGTLQVFSRAPSGIGTGTRVNYWSIGDASAGAKELRFAGAALGTLSWTPTATSTVTVADVNGLMMVSTGTLTLGSIPVVTTGGALTEDNSNFFYDTSTHRLGIGTNAPTAVLTVNGSSALQSLTFTDGTGTNVTTTALFATNGRFTNLSVTNPFSPTGITWTYATGTNTTGTNFYISNQARLPSDTQIASQAVCLSDGTNCPSGTTPTFQTVTNTGNTTTKDIQFKGGTSTWDFLVGANLTVTGTTDLQGLTLVAGTATNLFVTSATFTRMTATSATSTYLYAVNASTTNATATNLYVSNQLTGSGQNLSLARIGNSTYSTIQDLQNIFHSSGYTSGGEITDIGFGNISVAAGTGLLRPTASALATVFYADFAASTTIAIPTGTIRYIGVEYNSGSPQITSRTSANWDYKTDWPLGAAVNENGTMHLVNDVQGVGDHAANMIRRDYETMPLERDMRDGGLVFSESGTRNIKMTAGAIWDRLNRYAISALDTSVAGTFDAYYRDGGGGFTSDAGRTQWPNTQYDDGDGGLATLTDGYYAVLWFYVDTDGNVVMMYGHNQYAAAATAGTETPPDMMDLPDRLVAYGKLLGRIIFQKSAGSVTSVSSAFDTVFGQSLGISHANLENLDYDSSGHTGFAGTAATNTFTGGNTFTVVTSTSVTSTNLFATYGQFTNLLVTNPFSPTAITWTNATGTNTTGTNLYVSNQARLPTDTQINSQAVCLVDGTNCPSGTTPSLQTVTNTGKTTTQDIQFKGGTSTGNFLVGANLTVTGTTDLSAGLTFVSGTSSNWFGFASASGTQLKLDSLLIGTSTQDVSSNYLAQVEASSSVPTGIKVANFGTGAAAAAVMRFYSDTGLMGSIFANNSQFTTFANATSSFGIAAQGTNRLRLSTNGGDLRLTTDPTDPNADFVIKGTGATRGFIGIGTQTPTYKLEVNGGMLVTSLLWTNATGTNTTGTNLYISNQARLPTDTQINSQAVCLNDGTNCPTGTNPSFATVTNSGNTSSHDIQFKGGTSTGNFLVGANLTVTGTTDLQGNLTFVSGTSSNWFGFTTASGTLLNALTVNATNTTALNSTSTFAFATNASFMDVTSTDWLSFATASGTTMNGLTVNARRLFSPGAEFTNSTTTNATTTYGYVSNLTFVSGTSTTWFNFATASGTTMNGLTVNAGSMISPNVTITGGTINNTTIGLTTAAAAIFTNATATNLLMTNATSTAFFATVGRIDSLFMSNATTSALSVTNTLIFTDATGSLRIATSGTLQLTSGGATRTLMEMKELNSGFGLAVNAGAFMDRNSTIQEEFNKFRTTITADTAGAAGAALGDGGGWGGYESTNCNLSTPADTTNGILHIISVTAGNGCLAMMDDAIRNPRLILTATNLPVILMKVRPSDVSNANHFLYVGMADDTDGDATAAPLNFIGFANDGGATWVGKTITAGTATTTVTCTGQDISTSNYALLMVEVRSITNVRFFVDKDVTDGINFVECGGSEAAIPTTNLAPELLYEVRTGGVANTFLDVDFFRAWQDDPAADGVVAKLSHSTEPNYVSQSGLAQFFPSDDPDLAPGTLVSLSVSSTAPSVVPSTAAADPNMVGIVTGDPGLALGNGTVEGVRVVTHGRAQAFASAENGPIKPGDALTSASVPGAVMRATASGPMVGRALAAFPPAEDATSTATGTVLVLVQPGYYIPSVAGDSFFQIGTDGTSTASTLQATAPTPETVLPAGAEISQAMGVGTLVVRDASFTHSVIVLGTTTLRGPVVFGASNAGRVKVEPGQVDVNVTFAEPYPLAPHIFVSPEVEDLSGGRGFDRSIYDGGYYLTNVTTTGFGVRLPRGGYCPNTRLEDCPIALWLNWFVVGFESSASTTATVEASVTPPYEGGDGGGGVPPAPEVAGASTSTEPAPPTEAGTSSTSDVLPAEPVVSPPYEGGAGGGVSPVVTEPVPTEPVPTEPVPTEPAPTEPVAPVEPPPVDTTVTAP